ncbi:ABC transporter permease [Rhizohabitans arisaemae]|uniref:ABC transporter permease n=1 Tax=Rhizohabitans arisaemae TaxID=2720610 RepID=UPI0024B1A709|nr:ABC transporter permease [Rhizohabitans arisaemae]
MNKYLLPASGVAGFLIIWQIVGAFQGDFLSSPTRMVGEIVYLTTEGGLIGLVLITLGTMLIGWVLSIVIGVFVGFLIGRYRIMSVILEPYLIAKYSVPIIALVPLLVIWFGIEEGFLIATIIIATAIMLVFPTAAGTKETVRTYDQVARAYSISGWHFFIKILLPGSLPFIATGLRISVQRALMAVIVGEFLVGYNGLGTLLKDARIRLDADEVFAVAFIALLVGAVLTGAVGYLDRRLSSWRPVAVTS